MDTDVNKELKRKEKEFKEDIGWLMSSRRGRRIMWNVFVQSGLFGSTLDTNALMMAAREGRRQMANSLFGIIMQSCPDRYIEMTNENKDNL